MLMAICCACTARSGSRSGAGAITSWQMPSRWVEATTGQAATWPEGERATRAESSRRKSTRSSARMVAPDSKAGAQSSGPSTNHTPLPSYPPRVVFRTRKGSRTSSTSATEETSALRRARHPELGEPAPHHRLVLRVHQRLGPGSHRQVGLERVQVVGRHVLVVEGDHLAAGGDLAQGGEVGVVAHQLVGDHLCCAHARRLGEQPQRDAQRGGGFGHHPGQLAAADHGHDRGRRRSHGGPYRATSASAVVRTPDGHRLRSPNPRTGRAGSARVSYFVRRQQLGGVHVGDHPVAPGHADQPRREVDRRAVDVAHGEYDGTR